MRSNSLLSCRRNCLPPQPVRLTKDQARQIKESIAAHNDAVEAERRLINIFRDVWDGLAFTYIDKRNIKPMAFKEPAGFLSGKDGLSTELAILRGEFESGGIAILNDLTNCLRYGDVTLIRNHELAIVEAKTGRTLNQRGKRQLEANEKIRENLLMDRIVGLYGFDHEFHRIDLVHPEVSHTRTLQAMIDETIENGACYRHVEPGLHYIVDSSEDFEGFTRAVEAINGGLYVCMVNELKGHNTGYYPFTLSIANPNHVYAFYNGEFVLTIVVELEYVSQYFHSQGFFSSTERIVRVCEAEPS